MARLYLTPDALDDIRRARDRRASIRRNVVASAEEAAALPVRRSWIAPVEADPDYENLYDRFYAVMTDAAILEQLAFGAAISGRANLVEATRRHLVGTARAWRPERDVTPDYGTAYAITRLMKGLGVAWDVIGPSLRAPERRLVRSLIVDLAAIHWDSWFSQPGSAGPGAHTHHAHVEWASFGVTALAMLDQTTEAQTWLDAAVEKFRRDLLPRGLAADGAQIEGASFWASTMMARFLFTDALRRVTGTDLAAESPEHFPADISVAAIAGPRRHRLETEAESVLLEPDYAQLGYHTPALVALARLHRNPHLQALAGWDRWLGRMHEPGHIVPSGEQFRMCLGAYALLWYDPTIPEALGDSRRAFQFPSVDEAYLRQGWRPDGIVVAVKAGRLAVHAGGRPVLADLTPGRILDVDASVAAGTAVWHWSPPDLALTVDAVAARPDGGSIHAANEQGRSLTINLDATRLLIERSDGARRSWWGAHGASDAVTVLEGHTVRTSRRAHRPERRVGYGNLHVRAARDPARSLTVVEPGAGGRITIEVRSDPSGG